MLVAVRPRCGERNSIHGVSAQATFGKTTPGPASKMRLCGRRDYLPPTQHGINLICWCFVSRNAGYSHISASWSQAETEQLTCRSLANFRRAQWQDDQLQHAISIASQTPHRLYDLLFFQHEMASTMNSALRYACVPSVGTRTAEHLISF